MQALVASLLIDTTVPQDRLVGTEEVGKADMEALQPPLDASILPRWK